jgi:RecA-family ATPase
MKTIMERSHNLKSIKSNFDQLVFDFTFPVEKKSTLFSNKKCETDQNSFYKKQSISGNKKKNASSESLSRKSLNTSNVLKTELLKRIKNFTSYGHSGYEDSTAWLMQRILPTKSVGFLIGDSQAFKSFISVALGACISAGRSFGELKVPKERLVFLIAAEGGGSIPRRIKAESDIYGDVGERLIVIKKPINLNISDDSKMLSELISYEEARQGIGAGLVIIDTLSQCTAGMDENSSAEVALYLNACTEFSTKHKVTILNVHHNNRGGSYRGSGALFANSDFILVAKRKAKNITKSTLYIEKHKDASTDYYFEMSLDKYDLGLFDEFDEKIDTLSISRPKISDNSKNDTPPVKVSKSKQNQTWLLAQLQTAKSTNLAQTVLIELYMKHFNQDKDSSKQSIYRAVKELISQEKVKTETEGKSKLIFQVMK